MGSDDGARSLDRPTPDAIVAAYTFEEDVVDLGWEAYRGGGLRTILPYPEPVLEHVHRNDLLLTVGTRESADGCIEVAHVARRSRSFGMNFMSYDLERRCWAFKGEMRLLKHFLDVMRVYFHLGIVRKALVTSRTVFQPLCGLNPGLSRAAYEDKVKIGDCVLFLDQPLTGDGHLAGGGQRLSVRRRDLTTGEKMALSGMVNIFDEAAAARIQAEGASNGNGARGARNGRGGNSNEDGGDSGGLGGSGNAPVEDPAQDGDGNNRPDGSSGPVQPSRVMGNRWRGALRQRGKPSGDGGGDAKASANRPEAPPVRRRGHC